VKDVAKPILLSEHAKEQLCHRGATEEEITETILSAKWGPAELGRMECRKEFSFNKERNAKFYKRKQVRPIFIEEKEEIVIVTVYVYYS